jgi:cytochrome c553
VFCSLIKRAGPAILAGTLFLGLANGANAAGDPDRGRVLASTCGGCHAIPGYRNAYPSFRVPMLGGQHPEYIVLALQAYKARQRPHLTMQAQAASLSDQDMQDIAAYFANLGEPRTGPAVTGGDIGRGREKASTCVACHGETGISLTNEWPNLAGQHESYLVRTLAQYKSGLRQNAVMGGLVLTLTPQDMKDLAVYYAAQSGMFTATRD